MSGKPPVLNNQSVQKKPPYQALALIYDRIMDHVPYDRWAHYVKNIIQTHFNGVPRVLDVGCGTGRFMAEMQRLGFPVDGCDPSPAMLAAARRRLPGTLFRVSALPELVDIPAGEYNIVTCLYDSINYLPSIAGFKDSLRRVGELLPSGGLFIFDAVSDEFCQYYFGEYREEEVLDAEYAYTRHAFYDAKRRRQVNDFVIHTPDGVYREHHEQNIFPFDAMKYMIINQSPFTLVSVYEDFTFLDADEESNRAHFILKKTE